MDQQRPLNTWKEIADYLGVSVRKAQNLEKLEGMPVHRHGTDRSRVWANPSELDAWQKDKGTVALPKASSGIQYPPAEQEHVPVAQAAPSPETPPRNFRYIHIVIAVALALALGLPSAYFYSTSHAPPHNFRAGTQELIAISQTGRQVWQYAFPNPFFTPLYREQPAVNWVWAGSLEADRGKETLFRYVPHDWIEGGSALYCFSQTGKVRWQFRPGKKVVDASGAAYEVFGIGPIKVLAPSNQHQARLVVSNAHSLSYPLQVAVLNSGGQVLGEYWHSGHLLYLATSDIDHDGVEDILLGGINNGYKCASLVVLDPRNVSGASVQPAGDPTQLQGFGRGSEKVIIRFPRSCMNELLEPYNRVNLLAATKSSIEVQVVETSGERAAYLIYRFDPSLNLTGVIVSDVFISRHQELESTGQLKHSFSPAEKDKFHQQVRIIRKPASGPLVDSEVRR